MAKYSHRIQADRRTVTSRGMYIYGNTVRQAEVMPQRQEEPRKEHKKKKLAAAKARLAREPDLRGEG